MDSWPNKMSTFAESGVSTDIWTCYGARIMVISVIPFLVVQIPQALNSTSGRHLAILIGLIISLLLLVSYCVYQVSVCTLSFSYWIIIFVYLIWKLGWFVLLNALDILVKHVLLLFWMNDPISCDSVHVWIVNPAVLLMPWLTSNM
jgi:hypothetical protein